MKWRSRQDCGKRYDNNALDFPTPHNPAFENIAPFASMSNPDEGPPDPEKRSAAEAGNFDGTDYQHKAWDLQLYTTASALLQDRWCIGDEPTTFLIAAHIIDLWNSGVRMPELLTKVCTAFPHASQSEIEGGAALIIESGVRP